MDQSIEVTNIKNEPTDLTSKSQMEISSDIRVESVKKENNCLIQSEIYIKTEPQEDDSEFQVIAGTSYEMCSKCDMKIETEEPLIKIGCEDVVDELMQDPLDVGDEIKVKKHFQSNLDGEPRLKTESTEKEQDEAFLEINEDDLQTSGFNCQDKLLTRNDPDCKNKKFVCNECNKTFTQKSSLHRHLRIHTGEKTFICEICRKTFSLKHHLDEHILIHRGEKPHSCVLCKEFFRHKLSLDNHKLIHDGVKPFSCDVCGKSFTRKPDFIVHKRIHTGEKPYSCDTCEKAFVQKQVLIKHKRIHTGEKPYCCNVCTKSFADKGNFTRHKKIHKN